MYSEVQIRLRTQRWSCSNRR